jgi:hypothetical protein
MATIEETVFLPVLNESFTYSLSNDLEEIKKAIYFRTGINIKSINVSDWRLNTKLAKETKALMNKHNVSYSTTSRIEGDDMHIVINQKIENDYYIYNGQTINGHYFVDKYPEYLKLAKETFASFNIEEIIYAEYAEPGAMGNSGGLMFYIIIDGNLYSYETDIFNDKNTCENAIAELVTNAISSRYSDIKNNNGIFNFYNGGFGNNVFINKNIELNVGNGYFYYLNDGKAYHFYCSVRRVFDRVAYAIRRKIRNNTKIN